VKETTTMQSLELTKSKLVVYTMMIGIFTSGGNFLIKLLDDKNSFDYWRLVAVALAVAFIVIVSKGLSLISKKQKDLDYMQFEIETKRKTKNKIFEHEKKNCKK